MGVLKNKTAIITGAASGIGRASAILFAAEGAQVIASDLEEEALRETAALAGPSCRAAVADASDDAAMAHLVRTCLDDFGALDVFFANAGIAGTFQTVDQGDVDEWLQVLRVNLIGPFLAIKHASRPMRERGSGSILCTASVAGLRSGAGPSPYSASKAGVINLVQTSANQLDATGVRVNAICPGLIETGMTQPLFDMARAAGKEEKIGQLNPLKRAGQPAEIAAVALFLASDAASYVNGQAIAVDGGLSSSLPVVPGHLA